jgi:crotonobetainyl-CoA:carnitine CoA-transferase CaiB-like acyl-CoA transferase
MSKLPLEGVRVLDLSNLMAGPMSTMHLADFGADVIKVEHPAKGDEMRRWGNAKDDVGLFFKVVNRNKRTVTIDLRSNRGRELALRLAAESDVVVENFRTGTLEGWGLGYADMCQANPDIIMLHLTGFGRTGPRAHDPGFGSLVEAFAGASYINGHADREPLIQPFGLGDSSAAIFAAYSVLVALYHKVNGGGGQEIDLGLYEGLFAMLGPQVINYDQLGLVQERYGADNPFVAPRGTYRTKDNLWVAVSGSTQGTFERICRALAIEQCINDPRFVTNRLRVENGTELSQIIASAVADWNRADLVERARVLEATIGPVNNIRDAFSDEQFAARGNIAQIEDEELGPVRMQNVAAKLSRTPGSVRHAGPPKGRHNEEVFCGLLGLSEAELEALHADGAV